MKRKQHVIKAPEAKPRPGAVVFVQAEAKQVYESDADDTGHMDIFEWHSGVSIRRGKSWTTTETNHGKDGRKFWRWIKGLKTPSPIIWIVSYNAREVAATLCIWDRLEHGDLTTHLADPWQTDDAGEGCGPRGDGYIVLEGPPTVIAFRDPDTNVRYVWLDPQNFGCTLTDDLGGTYNTMGDVQEWFGGWIGTITALGESAWEHTAASQAHSIFKTHYMVSPIVVHDSEPALRMERAALYGGRCECRKLGYIYQNAADGSLFARDIGNIGVWQDTGSIYHLDVNSLYPSVAMDAMLPTSLKCLHGPCSVETMMHGAQNTAVIADVDVFMQAPVVPLKHEGRCIWPVGEFRTILCGPELLLARQWGHVKKCHAIAVYGTDPIYNAWVHKLYDMRREARQKGHYAISDSVKALLNSSFGKWAQQTRRWVDVPEFIPPMPYTQWYDEVDANGKPIQYRSLAWNVQRCEVQGETAESFPAITAYINSLGRVRLWELLTTAGLENVYYYDTDSIMCNELGYANLQAAGELHDTGLGKMKVRGVHSVLRLCGRQIYELDGQLTMAGLDQLAVRDGDAWAKVLKPYPLQHYLLKDEKPGIDHHLARLHICRAYRHGNVDDRGIVTPSVFKLGNLAT